MINQQELIKEIQKYATTVKLNNGKATKKLFQLALVDTITNTTFF
ncbi:hypothetical protein [Enterococcus sp. DIV0086]